jgi:flagellar biosynthesis component FlhA
VRAAITVAALESIRQRRRRRAGRLGPARRHGGLALAIPALLIAVPAALTVSRVAFARRVTREVQRYEMAAAMVLPVLPFLCLVWFDVTKGAQCGPYCMTTIVAMLVLMRYRRSTYSMAM